MSDVRVAIIGYGVAGRFFHAPLIAATSGLAVATVVTANPERQAEVRRAHPDARVLDGSDELWARGDTDLVVIAAPNRVHAVLASEAIARGIPVVVDKPLAVNFEEGETLVMRSEQAGVLLTVFQNRRWDSDYLTVKRLIAEGRLGTVMRFESRFERWRPSTNPGAWRESASPDEGGGQLLDLGSHLVDQVLALFGPATHVYGEVDARRGMLGDDDAFLALRHQSGVLSHLRASAVTAAPGPRLRVLGTKAAFIASHLDSQEEQLRAGIRPDARPDWGMEPRSRWGRLLIGDESAPVPSERGAWPDFYATLRAALQDGGAPPVDPHDAMATLRVLESARRSARERAVVAVHP